MLWDLICHGYKAPDPGLRCISELWHYKQWVKMSSFTSLVDFHACKWTNWVWWGCGGGGGGGWECEWMQFCDYINLRGFWYIFLMYFYWFHFDWYKIHRDYNTNKKKLLVVSFFFLYWSIHKFSYHRPVERPLMLSLTVKAEIFAVH